MNGGGICVPYLSRVFKVAVGSTVCLMQSRFDMLYINTKEISALAQYAHL